MAAESSDEEADHCFQLSRRCRLCGSENEGRQICSTKYSAEFLGLFGIDVSADLPSVHPKSICKKCRCVLDRFKNHLKKETFHTSVEPCTFKPHNSACTICYGNATDDHSYHTKQQRGRKRKTTHAGPGRPRKKESPATEKSQTESDIESSATNISHASTQTNTTSRTDSGTQTDTSTCGYIVDAENPDVSDIPLPVLCNFVKAAAQSQRRSIQQDTSGIAGLHKESQTLSNIDPATYYSNRNSLCTSFVDGLVDQKTTVSSKVMTVEQIYHVVSPVLVAPFTFTRNLLCYAATNSKLVVNMLGKVSAGGMIETVKTYLDNMATKPLPFPKGDSEVAIDNDQKWPSETHLGQA
ncbi:uncharacterized protein LOC144914729 isoform X1 [Branchiostoma floridae x Branchiostoma belcheri]